MDGSAHSGPFTFCYLDLCIIRYLQYLVAEEGVEVMSAERIMKAMDEPSAVILGQGDKVYLGASVTADYLAIAKLLGIPMLQKTMSTIRFRALTKLDAVKDIRTLVG